MFSNTCVACASMLPSTILPVAGSAGLWRDSFDWETGAFIETVQISSDYYNPGRNVYYVGVQQRPAATPFISSTGSTW